MRLLGLEKSDDLTIWRYAKENGFHLVTKDVDFHDINTLYGFPPKIIRIHSGNTTTTYITELLRKKHTFIQSFLANGEIGYLELE